MAVISGDADMTTTMTPTPTVKVRGEQLTVKVRRKQLTVEVRGKQLTVKVRGKQHLVCTARQGLCLVLFDVATGLRSAPCAVHKTRRGRG